LFIAGGITIFGSLALLFTHALDLEVNSKNYIYIVQSISALGFFFIPALIFSYCATKSCFAYSDSNKTAPPQLVGYVLILSFLILPIIACLGYLNEQLTLPESMHKFEILMQKMEEAAKMMTETLTANSTIPILLTNIILMSLLPALFEEFLFRGTIQPLFNKWFGNKHVAIIITAFIFSFIHFQFYGFLPRFLLGIYLGYLLILGKTLRLPILAHFMHNALSLIFDYVAQQFT
jgi:membrane protease YdiL (CAAX protease family)